MLLPKCGRLGVDSPPKVLLFRKHNELCQGICGPRKQCVVPKLQEVWFRVRSTCIVFCTALLKMLQHSKPHAGVWKLLEWLLLALQVIEHADICFASMGLCLLANLASKSLSKCFIQWCHGVLNIWQYINQKPGRKWPFCNSSVPRRMFELSNGCQVGWIEA